MKNSTHKERSLMYCPQCGNRIKQNESFCSRCGYRTAGQYGAGSGQNASSASWIVGIITAVIALAAVVGLILIAPAGGGANIGGNTGGSSSAGQIAGTWQLISYENEMGKTDMTTTNTQVAFAADGTLSTSEGDVSTLQGAHWEWTDQDTIKISGGSGDVIMDITFGQVDGKDGFTAVVTNTENPDKKEIFTFVKVDGAQGSGTGEGVQGTQTSQETQQGTNGVDIGQMTLQELQGEWRGTGILTSLENTDKYVWNWELLPDEEVALYNSMVGVENTCYFGIDQDNDVGCELLAEGTYWRGLFDEGTGTTFVNGELSASFDIAEQYSCRIHAVLSADDDGVLMLRGTVDTVIYEGPLGGPYDEVTYSISFTVKKFD